MRVTDRGGTMSLPSWERGLKYTCVFLSQFLCRVAPLVGAWIEIQLTGFVRVKDIVAPLVGAWIEISYYGYAV